MQLGTFSITATKTTSRRRVSRPGVISIYMTMLARQPAYRLASSPSRWQHWRGNWRTAQCLLRVRAAGVQPGAISNITKTTSQRSLASYPPHEDDIEAAGGQSGTLSIQDDIHRAVGEQPGAISTSVTTSPGLQKRNMAPPPAPRLRAGRQSSPSSAKLPEYSLTSSPTPRRWCGDG